MHICICSLRKNRAAADNDDYELIDGKVEFK